MATNVKATVNGNKLTLEVDLSETHGKSSSGKTETVATTHGFDWTTCGEYIGFSLNVCKRNL